MRSIVFLFIGFLIWAVPAAKVRAQRNPTMTEQQRESEKERYFAKLNELRRVPTADSQRRAYEAAVEYLKRFEGDNDPDARNVRKFVTEYERGIRQYDLFNLYNSKNYVKAFELGRTLIKRDPDNFLVLAVLTEAGMDNAQAGNTSLNEATLNYAQGAIRLMEADKVKNAEPFKNIEVARGYLNASIGTLLRDKAPAEAAQAYRKAVQSESFYRTDPLTYHRIGIAILKGEFTQLSNEYNQKYGGQPSSPGQRAMLERINKLAAQVMDAYARAVALSDPARVNAPEAGVASAQFPPELRNKILEQLTSLYKSFHDNSDAGLNDLISTVLSKPMP